MRSRFEWDPAKAAANERKHGITFDLALRVFADPFLLMIQDRVEDGEQRWQTLGSASGYVLLLVVHTLRETVEDGEDMEVIRIISARKADRSERRRYEEEPR
ncbi:BrnT family toxin [Methylobacterium sp. sgz302541]|uniref:BrnT family toxin n=1 Tax=unclassified Methylobacterium TaxID=2615210 RepID=UPI003D3318E8